MTADSMSSTVSLLEHQNPRFSNANVDWPQSRHILTLLMHGCRLNIIRIFHLPHIIPITHLTIIRVKSCHCFMVSSSLQI
ncbi:hypothetical protein EYC84_010421 [Monilinia fructicola]|uniref:Uncharacterized protein n=1 Tax=Monilinia fructicola TaxID=38448 RepID=A0A5M9JGG1_MONFR|nr:hypothetical protein EYC84_010421 [Monilinia fructicola]